MQKIYDGLFWHSAWVRWVVCVRFFLVYYILFFLLLFHCSPSYPFLFFSFQSFALFYLSFDCTVFSSLVSYWAFAGKHSISAWFFGGFFCCALSLRPPFFAIWALYAFSKHLHQRVCLQDGWLVGGSWIRLMIVHFEFVWYHQGGLFSFLCSDRQLFMTVVLNGLQI